MPIKCHDRTMVPTEFADSLPDIDRTLCSTRTEAGVLSPFPHLRAARSSRRRGRDVMIFDNTAPGSRRWKTRSLANDQLSSI